MDLMIEDLMEQLVEGGGSDLHIATGQPLTAASAVNYVRCVTRLWQKKTATS